LISPTVVTATVPAGATGDTLSVTTPGGTATYPSGGSPFDGSADITLPDLGNGFTMIPTPNFTYSNITVSKWFTFATSAWGNTLGTDSTRQAVGSKFLLPQTSLFGARIQANARITNQTSEYDFSFFGEANFLIKKVAFFDTSQKTNTAFNPLVLQGRFGCTFTVQNLLFVGIYANILSVETENTNVSNFFGTGGQNVFAYPEADIAFIFPVSKGSAQRVRIELDNIINNGSTNHFYQSSNSLIPYIKIGFATNL